MNRVFLVGNITGDIYYDRLLIKERSRPFLRLILMSQRPKVIRGLRINLWDEKAELYYPYLQRGARIAVVGNILSREFKGNLIHEIEALNLILLRNINWEFGEQERIRHQLPRPSASANNVFVVGKVGEGYHLDWFKRANEDGSYALLRIRLSNEQYLDGLRVNIIGSLAELVHPYLRKDAMVAVDGHFQTRSRETGAKVVEVTAEHITFLEGVDWEAGTAAQAVRSLQVKEEIGNEI